MSVGFWRGFRDGDRKKELESFIKSPLGERILLAKCKGKNVFQLCIRDHYLNIYWNGCSIMNYKPCATKNKFTIHYKYIDKELNINKKKPYIPLLEQNDDFVYKEREWSFIKNIIEPIERGSKVSVDEYVSDEKEDLTRYLSKMNSSILIDLEIAFSRQRDEEEMKGKTRDTVADRIDMARIVMKGRIPVLQLVEVKLDNDDRLRSEKGTPKILKQMASYRKFLNDNKDDIMDSYNTVAKNYIELGLAEQMDGFGDKTAREILKVFSTDGELDPNPYLLVLGEEKNMMGKLNHWDKLKELLEKDKYPMPEISAI